MEVHKFVVKIVLMVLIPVVTGIATYRYLNTMLKTPVEPGSKQVVSILISAEDDFSSVRKKIFDEKLVRSEWVLDLIHRIKGKDLAIKAGEYQVSPGMSPAEILALLKSGDIVIREFELKAGESMTVIPARVEEAGITTAESVRKALRDPNLLGQAGIPAETFEGFLAPGTYRFNKGDAASQIVLKMFSNGKELWHSSYDEVAQNLGLTRLEILTLASLLEKDSAVPEDQAFVSAIYHKNLKGFKKLNSMSSLKFGLSADERDAPMKREYFRRVHPYNTFVNYGLPVAPITTPSAGAIVAALYPQEGVEAVRFLVDWDTLQVQKFTEESEYAAAWEARKRKLLGLDDNKGSPESPTSADTAAPQEGAAP